MDTNDLSSFKSLFLATAREQLHIIQNSLKILSDNPDDSEASQKVYIAAHSLKGEHFAMGYISTGQLCHVIENVFHEVKDQKRILTKEVIEVVQKNVFHIAQSVDCIEKENKEMVLNQELLDLERLTGVVIENL